MSSDTQRAAPPPGRQRDGYVGSVLKAVQLVEALAERDGDVSLSELAHATGQPVASTYRMIVTLEHAGWMIRGDEGGYRLSLRLAQVASGVLSGMSMRAKARPILVRLTAQIGETSYLALRDDDHVTCLERVESSTLVRVMTWDVGQSLPLNLGAASLAILAHLTGPEASAAALGLGSAPGTTGAPRARDASLAARLARIRRDGYSVSIEEVTPGVASIGAAVFDASAQVTASISVGGLAPSIRGRTAEIATAVRSAAEAISRTLGYTGGYPPLPAPAGTP